MECRNAATARYGAGRSTDWIKVTGSIRPFIANCVSISDDPPQVTSSLLVTVTAAGSITVVMANDQDNNPVSLTFTARTYQLNIQARTITAIGTGIAVVALWS